MKPVDKYTLFLIEQAQAGRKNSYLELIGFYKKQVFLRSLQLLGKIEDAEKVSREVFFRAWQNIKLVNEFIPFELWLRGLTINVAMSYLRDKTKSESNDKIEDNNLSVQNENDKKILSLPLQSRQILILHDLEGYTFPDIAALLDKEDDFSDFGNLLEQARKKIADENEIEILQKFEEEEWLKLLSDFDFWPIDKTSSKNMTERIKAVLSFREKLELFLSSNEPSEETFDKLINYFFIHGEKVVQERKKEKEIWKASFGEAKADKIKRIPKKIEDSDKQEKGSTADAIAQNASKGIGKISFVLSSLAIIVIIFLLFFSSDNFPWKVTSSYGKYLIGSLENQKEINKGDEIKTSSGSGVTFQIESVGKIELKENTTAKALTGDNDMSVIELTKGALRLSTRTEVPKLQIVGNGFKLLDYGSDTDFSLDRKKISVQRGGVKLFYDEKEFPIFEDYQYVFGKSAPVNILAVEEMKNAIDQITIPVKFDANLERVISLSNESDALTIWTLLRYSDKGATAILFNKLNEFFPLSENISEKDILNLNKEKINEWLDEIEWQL